MDDQKTEYQALSDALCQKKDLAWNRMDEGEQTAAFHFCEGYKAFLGVSKTERLCAAFTVMLAEKKGFKPLDYYISEKGKVEPGDRIYILNRRKTVSLFIVGKAPLEQGIAIIGAHIDAPRLDLKPTPLYEENDMAYFKTHYYGGIKKYQWVTIPLALHGTIAKKDGELVNISIGEKDEDPVFCITDLLPHLAQEQSQKKLGDAIVGEGLNLLIGSIPLNDAEIKDPVKLNILKYLNEHYGITEEDFTSAELEAVPAGAARDIGFDRSFVGAYGQDDRVCAYSAAQAILDYNDQHIPERTLCVLLADKEEIGSYGSTGMQSKFFENQVAELIQIKGDGDIALTLRRCLEHSEFLSADVTAAYDPNFTGTHDLKNATFAGKGVAVNKYGGARGKSGCNDANAEFLGKIRRCFDGEDVVWQTGELGRIDLGGGGTIAWILAQYGMDVVDCGTPVLSMHAPFELTSKADVYMTYKAYRAFLTSID
ncbi:aminopeptidase [Eubacterium sp.]|uniref:aminopeptidase n=1 Tax=Eubacterium sp. TaxID=142586 RepID=UPI002FCB0907